MSFRTLLFGLVLSPLSLQAQCGFAQTLPAPVVLPNGLRVLVRERHNSPLVAIDLWVRAGSREEQSGEYGAAHFLEHTLFKGTTTRGPGDADLAIENLGATLNAATGPDYAHFYTTVARVHLAPALDVLADVARNATLPEAEIEKERGVILDELAQHTSDPAADLLDQLYARAFETHPYHRSPGGTPEAIRQCPRDTLAAFYRRLYRPERCTLVFVGDITPATARSESVRVFGAWMPPREKSSHPPESSPDLPPSEPREADIRETVASPRIGLAFHAPVARDHPMACAAQVVAELLGESEGFGRLAIESLAGTEADARYTPRRDASLFVLAATLPGKASARVTNGPAVPPTSLTTLENTLLTAVRSLQIRPPTRAELNAAISRLLGRTLFESETNAGLARALGYADCTGGDSPESLREQLLSLTTTDVQRFVQTYLDPAHRVTVRLRPAKERQE